MWERLYISVTRKCNIWNNTIGISRNNIRIWARLDKYRLSHRNSSSLTDIMILYTLSLSLSLSLHLWSISISFSPGEETSMKAGIIEVSQIRISGSWNTSWHQFDGGFNACHPFSSIFPGPFQPFQPFPITFGFFDGGFHRLSVAFNGFQWILCPSNSHALLRWPRKSAERSCCAAMAHQRPKLPGAAPASCISTLPGPFLSWSRAPENNWSHTKNPVDNNLR